MNADQELQNMLRAFALSQAQRASEAAEKFARNVVPELVKLGVVTVTAHYSGYGDSGGVEECDFMTPDGKLKQLPPQSVIDGVCDYVESLLPPGYEINDGGQGNVALDIVRGTYKVHHETNVTRQEVEEKEGEF